MKTEQVELALMYHIDFRVNHIVTGIRNMMGVVGFETDVLVINKNNYATAIEIKVSKSDLKADLKKDHIKYLDKDLIQTYGWSGAQSPFEVYYKKIKKFYYAVPEELKEDAFNQIPDFAGLITLRDGKHIPAMTYERRAKTINKHQWSDKEVMEVLRLGNMRVYNLKRKLYLKSIGL